MTRVRSTSSPRDAAVETGSEGHGGGDSAERMESAPLSDVVSHNRAGADVDEGSCTQSYFFGPSTMAVSWIRGMIDNDYFVEGMGREPEEKTVLEPQSDEAMVFEEFFTAGLRMPPHLVLSYILLKFQVQLHQLTPNAIIELSNYIWAVTSFRGIPSVDRFAKRYKLHYQPRKVEVGGAKVRGSTGAFIFMPNVEARVQSLLSPSRTSRLDPRLWRGSTVRFPYFRARAPCEVMVYMRSAQICAHWIL
jgi:hypothetical protein